MKTLIKAIIRWLSEDDNAGKVVAVVAVAGISTMVGIGSGSVWIGIFFYPLLILAILGFAIAVCIPVGLCMYALIKLPPLAWAKLTDWAYTGETA